MPLLAVYDLEPRKVTGIVKYVGKVDREYVDNRVYVGVRLDDPGELQGHTPPSSNPLRLKTFTS